MQGLIFKHIMSKACQYAITNDKVSVDMKKKSKKKA